MTNSGMAVRKVRTGVLRERDYGRNKEAWDAQKSLSDKFKDKDALIRSVEFEKLQKIFFSFKRPPKSVKETECKSSPKLKSP